MTAPRSVSRWDERVSDLRCRACIYANLSPVKDMEVVVTGRSLTCKTFQSMTYTALRALIDRLGVATFNAAILGIDLELSDDSSADTEKRFPGISAR